MIYITTLGKRTSSSERRALGQRCKGWSAAHVAAICRDIKAKARAVEAQKRSDEQKKERERHLKNLSPHPGLQVKQLYTEYVGVISRVEFKKDGVPIIYLRGRRSPVNPYTLERV